MTRKLVRSTCHASKKKMSHNRSLKWRNTLLGIFFFSDLETQYNTGNSTLMSAELTDSPDVVMPTQHQHHEEDGFPVISGYGASLSDRNLSSPKCSLYACTRRRTCIRLLQQQTACLNAMPVSDATRRFRTTPTAGHTPVSHDQLKKGNPPLPPNRNIKTHKSSGPSEFRLKPSTSCFQDDNTVLPLIIEARSQAKKHLCLSFPVYCTRNSSQLSHALDIQIIHV